LADPVNGERVTWNVSPAAIMVQAAGFVYAFCFIHFFI
jgi:hypothetical protein